MTLGEKQELFLRLLSGLIVHAFSRPGWTARGGELYRPPETAAVYARDGRGVANSNHTRKIAIDLMLIYEGKLISDSAQYGWLGEWWEQQHPLARWGGRFSRPDGGHFSLHHDGVA